MLGRRTTGRFLELEVDFEALPPPARQRKDFRFRSIALTAVVG